MFEFDVSDSLRETIRNLESKDRPLAIALKKKIREVDSRDSQTIDFYKNLRKPLQESKRAHVGNFVFIFKVYKERQFIFFQKFEHHDTAYRR